jgi:hypothetical protein
MHERVERPKTLAALWRAPDDNEAGARQKTLDEIPEAVVGFDVVERDEREAGGLGVRGPEAFVDNFLCALALCAAGIARRTFRKLEGLRWIFLLLDCGNPSPIELPCALAKKSLQFSIVRYGCTRWPVIDDDPLLEQRFDSDDHTILRLGLLQLSRGFVAARWG